ncbi:transmembrane protein 11, mitochondrial-like [Limulus polyphemus]|uniref:Transmembrane protein 11, mitochondrial-like n=1 Tax=Limulus polyphemus TaxID=6850 RepID=A0ABM1B291_LIMPO|nr:transmembrane protein 11, mitochondrial-like [Limulus polyphemus]
MEGFEGDREYTDIPDIAIVREIYDGENAHEAFENELERALEAGCSTILIEPSRLGEETARWIAVGNCLHKTAVLAGFGSIVSAVMWPNRLYISCPLGAVSFFTAGLYTVAWQFDPCCKYQLEKNPKTLSKLPLHTLISVSPVVLVRRDDTRKKILHTATTLAALSICVWRLYKLYSPRFI